MKPIAFVVALFASLLTLHAEQAPSLSLEQAKEIAQATLDGLKLPPDNFIRSVTLQHDPKAQPSDFYIATFEPPKKIRVQRDNRPAEPPPTVKVIKVTFDGKAAVIDLELPSRGSRR